MPVLSEAEGPRPNVAGIDLASAPEYGAKRYNRVGLAAPGETPLIFPDPRAPGPKLVA